MFFERAIYKYLNARNLILAANGSSSNHHRAAATTTEREKIKFPTLEEKLVKQYSHDDE